MPSGKPLKNESLGSCAWVVGIIVLISTGTCQLHLALYPDKEVCQEKLYSCIFNGLCLLWWGIVDFILLDNFCMVCVEELTLLYEQALWLSKSTPDSIFLGRLHSTSVLLVKVFSSNCFSIIPFCSPFLTSTVSLTKDLRFCFWMSLS